MRMTKTFGPMFTMILVMFGDLLQFIVFWVLILFTFTCVASLIWGQNTTIF